MNIGDRKTLADAGKIKVLNRQNWRCSSCDKPFTVFSGFDIDHIFAIHKGGGNEIRNLHALCKECHKIKTSAERGLFEGRLNLKKLQKDKANVVFMTGLLRTFKTILMHFTPEYSYCYKRRYKEYYRRRNWLKQARAVA